MTVDPDAVHGVKSFKNEGCALGRDFDAEPVRYGHAVEDLRVPAEILDLIPGLEHFAAPVGESEEIPELPVREEHLGLFDRSVLLRTHLRPVKNADVFLRKAVPPLFRERHPSVRHKRRLVRKVPFVVRYQIQPLAATLEIQGQDDMSPLSPEIGTGDRSGPGIPALRSQSFPEVDFTGKSVLPIHVEQHRHPAARDREALGVDFPVLRRSGNTDFVPAPAGVGDGVRVEGDPDRSGGKGEDLVGYPGVEVGGRVSRENQLAPRFPECLQEFKGGGADRIGPGDKELRVDSLAHPDRAVFKNRSVTGEDVLVGIVKVDPVVRQGMENGGVLPLQPDDFGIPGGQTVEGAAVSPGPDAFYRIEHENVADRRPLVERGVDAGEIVLHRPEIPVPRGLVQDAGRIVPLGLTLHGIPGQVGAAQIHPEQGLPVADVLVGFKVHLPARAAVELREDPRLTQLTGGGCDLLHDPVTGVVLC